jgi:hypothetical protein
MTFVPWPRGRASLLPAGRSVRRLRHLLPALATAADAETEKADGERGYYRHPEVYGLGEVHSVVWATHRPFLEAVNTMSAPGPGPRAEEA